MKEPINRPWVRWIAVLPSAILAYCLLQALFILLGLLLALPLNVEKYVTQLIATIACPYYFVFMGAKMAPSFRFRAAVALTIVIALLGMVVAGLAIQGADSDDPAWYILVSVFASIASAIVAAARIHADDRSPPSGQMANWKGASYLVLGNICGIIYAYGYFGQAILFGRMFWFEITKNWLSLFNPLLDLQIVITALFTWYFWTLIIVAAIGYYAMTFFFNKAADYSV